MKNEEVSHRMRYLFVLFALFILISKDYKEEYFAGKKYINDLDKWDDTPISVVDD